MMRHVQQVDHLGVIMRVEVVFHNERAFERWLRRTGGDGPGRIAGKIALVAEHGGAVVGMPLVRSLGGDLHEIRITTWRIYFAQEGAEMTVLCAGTKDTQQRDIARARGRMA
jgi:putative addiction module killer protein